MNLPHLPLLAVNFLSSPLYTLLGTNDLRNPPPPPIRLEDHMIPPKKYPRPQGEKSNDWFLKPRSNGRDR